MKIKRPQKRQLHRQRQKLRRLYFVQRGKMHKYNSNLRNAHVQLSQSGCTNDKWGSGVGGEETPEEKEGFAL